MDLHCFIIFQIVKFAFSGSTTGESDERVTRASVHPRSVESTFSKPPAEKTPIASTDGASGNTLK